MSKYRTSVLVLTIVVVLVSAWSNVKGWARPTVDGTWKMNAARSKFVSREAPASLSIKFQSEGPVLRETLTVVNAAETSTTDLQYNLDGKEITNQVGDQEIKSSAKWDADALVLEWKDNGGTATFRFRFSDDGRTMTMDVTDSNPDSPSGDVVVLQKQ